MYWNNESLFSSYVLWHWRLFFCCISSSSFCHIKWSIYYLTIINLTLLIECLSKLATIFVSSNSSAREQIIALGQEFIIPLQIITLQNEQVSCCNMWNSFNWQISRLNDARLQQRKIALSKMVIKFYFIEGYPFYLILSKVLLISYAFINIPDYCLILSL